MLAEAARLVPNGVICLASALAFHGLTGYRGTVGELLAVEGLRQALRRRKATPAQLARETHAAGVCRTMQPCLMALTSDA